MTTATQNAGSITVYTGGLSPTVTITLNGDTATLFSDQACITSQANPFTPTEDTTVYVTNSGQYVVSATVNGVELVGDGGIFVQNGDSGNPGVRCAADPAALAQALSAGGGSSQPVVITDPNDVRVAESGKTYIYDPTSPQPQLEATDAVLTNGSPTLTSVVGGFSTGIQVGNVLDDVTTGGAGVIPIGTVVQAIVDDNTLTMSANATGDADPDPVNIGFGALLQVPAAVGTAVTVMVTKASGGGVLLGTSPSGGNIDGNPGLFLIGAGQNSLAFVFGDDGTNIGAAVPAYIA